jgi:hypothetical protein
VGLSDDSHGKYGVGLNYSRLANYLKMSGITDIYSLTEGGTGVGARRVSPTVVNGDWRNDPFWNRLPQ